METLNGRLQHPYGQLWVIFPGAMSYGYNEALVGGQPPVQIQRVGGWKLLLGAVLAAVGIGFAGYVYLVPYQKLTKALNASTTELADQRSASEELVAERDKLKAEVAKHEGANRDAADVKAKKQEKVEAFSIETKAALGAFGATLSSSDGHILVGFPASAVFEQPTSTVISAQGDAALKLLATSVKKEGFRTRVKAKLIPAPPPRELSAFKNIGEFAMLRAVRVALALAAGGVPPERAGAVGETPGAHKGKAAVPDRLEIEIEPE